MTVLWWARRDLRLADNPALCAAAAEGDVLPVVVVDERLLGSRPRDAWYAANVLDLDERLEGALCLALGDPATMIPKIARAVGAKAVHVSRETTRFGARRDAQVRERLAEQDVDWTETGSPYAVTPGRVTKNDGTPYRVFTAFEKVWRTVELRTPPARPRNVEWASAPDGIGASKARTALQRAVDGCAIDLPTAGEAAARKRWRTFLRDQVDDYGRARDRPDHDATSRLSAYLKVGAIHPRTLLDDLAGVRSDGAAKYASEIAWREFYADVLFHEPQTIDHDLTDALTRLPYDEPGEEFTAWQRGETGFPLVDAGMRQLLAEGWMHNRVRMVVASFLAKDLHVWWPHGARHFMDHLIDGDPASNSHGWQWVAGTGTDAAPYFRVFNPTTQATKFDPQGEYVRRYVPELRHLHGKAALEPWKHRDGYEGGYPEPICEHAQERRETLARYDEARN